MDENNVYLRTYGVYPKGSKRLKELSVGERIQNVVFALSGEKGSYEIWRVE
jgi:hypothetical protein